MTVWAPWQLHSAIINLKWCFTLVRYYILDYSPYKSEGNEGVSISPEILQVRDPDPQEKKLMADWGHYELQTPSHWRDIAAFCLFCCYFWGLMLAESLWQPLLVADCFGKWSQNQLNITIHQNDLSELLMNSEKWITSLPGGSASLTFKNLLLTWIKCNTVVLY